MNKIETGVITPTHDYVDGKQVYVKRVSTGNLPNNTRKTIATGLSGISLVKLEGVGNHSDYNSFIPLPYVYGTSEVITISYSNGNLRIDTIQDSTKYSGYVDIYFTYN